MERYKIPLVDESGETIGYGDRWRSHTVRDGPRGPILGQRHIGITIACLDENGRILVQHRKHRIFDKFWSLSGDTHPRKYGSRRVESLAHAAKRCAWDDLGVVIRQWTQTISVSYSARDPRDPRYCENELLYVLLAKHDGQVHLNETNVYDLLFTDFADIWGDSKADMKKKPISRKYAPWVHALFSLPRSEIEDALQLT